MTAVKSDLVRSCRCSWVHPRKVILDTCHW